MTEFNELVMALGRVVVAGSSVEREAQVCEDWMYALGVEQAPPKQQPISGVLARIRRSVHADKVTFDSGARERIIAWTRSAEDALKGRNRVIHANWVHISGADGRPTLAGIRVRRGVTNEVIPADLAELSVLTGELTRAMLGGAQIAVDILQPLALKVGVDNLRWPIP